VGLDRHKQIGPSGASSLKFFFFLRRRDGAACKTTLSNRKTKELRNGILSPRGRVREAYNTASVAFIVGNRVATNLDFLRGQFVNLVLM
jgi:hypothetical protein